MRDKREKARSPPHGLAGQVNTRPQKDSALPRRILSERQRAEGGKRYANVYFVKYPNP